MSSTTLQSIVDYLVAEGHSASCDGGQLTVEGTHVILTVYEQTVAFNIIPDRLNGKTFKRKAKGFDTPAIAKHALLWATTRAQADAEGRAIRKAMLALEKDYAARIAPRLPDDVKGCQIRFSDDAQGLNVTLENLSVEQALAVLTAAGKLKPRAVNAGLDLE